jgi:hypothetical protein
MPISKILLISYLKLKLKWGFYLTSTTMGESREKVLTRIRKERGERFLKRIIFFLQVCVWG